MYGCSAKERWPWVIRWCCSREPGPAQVSVVQRDTVPRAMDVVHQYQLVCWSLLFAVSALPAASRAFCVRPPMAELGTTIERSNQRARVAEAPTATVSQATTCVAGGLSHPLFPRS
jgi:hypothetical protein